MLQVKKGGDSNSENTGPTTSVRLRRTGRSIARAKTSVAMTDYNVESKLLEYEDELAQDPVFKSLVAAVEENGCSRFTNRIFHDLTVAIHARGKKKAHQATS